MWTDDRQITAQEARAMASSKAENTSLTERDRMTLALIYQAVRNAVDDGEHMTQIKTAFYNRRIGIHLKDLGYEALRYSDIRDSPVFLSWNETTPRGFSRFDL